MSFRSSGGAPLRADPRLLSGDPYRDTKLLAAIPIGKEEEVLPSEMDTQKIVSTPNF